MEESPNTALSSSDSKKWIVRIVLALVLGQAIWGLVVSLTTGLLVPLTARVMGNDPASALYLGKGDIDIPALFISILEFCMAGIVAAILNSWVQKPPRMVRRKVATSGSISLQSPAVLKPPVVSAPTAPPAKPAVQNVAPVAPAPAAKPLPAAPSEPAKPKRVYYNSVGDPITMDDD
jgi:hypothetical protein